VRQHSNGSGFLRHVRACNNWRPPGGRAALRIEGQVVGWVAPVIRDALAGMDDIAVAADGLHLLAPAALPAIVERLSERMIVRLRGEAFDVRASIGGPVLSKIDRGALPGFGVHAVGVHVNGLVRRDGQVHLWVARRAADKQLDPSKLDHIVAGGVSAGMGAQDTLVKEAAEEAGIPSEVAATARACASLAYAMERQEGVRRDHLVCYDLDLPADFVPQPMDGEVAGFELWPIEQVVEVVRETDDFKFNVNLVLIDLFLRNGLIGEAEAAPLAAALYRGPTIEE
jgi:8-oxo-dGTP pyrophosphatase MutT (NUDIX family)